LLIALAIELCCIDHGRVVSSVSRRDSLRRSF